MPMVSPFERPRTILLVDDDRGVQHALADVLEDEGYQVAVVGSGREALDYLHRSAQLPALILLDLVMPNMSGVEFRMHQQHEPLLAQIPVVVMSANMHLAQATHILGVREYLQKPFDWDTLLAVVFRHCGYGAALPIASSEAVQAVRAREATG